MSTSTMVCHLLACDRCKEPYRDHDHTEGRYHAPTVEEIRRWAAVSDSWVITPDEDVCDECAKAVAGKPHEFRPGPDLFCAWCKEWADYELHTNAPVLGQTEMIFGQDGGVSS